MIGFKPRIIKVNGEIRSSSLDLAKAKNKPHSIISKIIENIPSKNKTNDFKVINYHTGSGMSKIFYLITEKGMMDLSRRI